MEQKEGSVSAAASDFPLSFTPLRAQQPSAEQELEAVSSSSGGQMFAVPAPSRDVRRIKRLLCWKVKLRPE
ncbi:hypothetical protein GN956_G19011 [Arapaima gigas]